MAPTSLILLLALTGAASAKPADALKSAIEDFEFGEHAEAAKKLSKLLDPIQLDSAEDLIVARQYLGACYYLLDDRARAEAEFAKILAVDPNHKLDPEVFSPALVQFYEEVRARTGLSLRRPDPKPAPAPKATQVEAPPPPPPPLVKPEPVLVPPAIPEPERPPIGLSFIPFGVGQFNNGHPVRGALFAASEVALLGTAAASFAMFNGIGRNVGGEFTVDTQEERDRAATLQAVYLATFYSALGVMAIGIAEALISYPGD